MSSDCSAPQIFEQDYYQRLHDIEEQHWWAQGMRDAMEALLRRPLGATTAPRVLDVGCGTGYLLHHMQERYSLKQSPIGIDVSDLALKFCQERGIRSLAVGRADQLPFASSTYDLVVCVDTIQHLSPGEVEMTLREVARTLRPGGLLYLRTNSALCHRRFEGADPARYRRYRLRTVINLLQQCGFEVLRATYLNTLPAVWGLLKEFLGSNPSSGSPLGPGLTIRPYPARLLWLNGLLHGVLRLEAWLLGRVRLDFPFGHSSGFVARRRLRQD